MLLPLPLAGVRLWDPDTEFGQALENALFEARTFYNPSVNLNPLKVTWTLPSGCRMLTSRKTARAHGRYDCCNLRVLLMNHAQVGPEERSHHSDLYESVDEFVRKLTAAGVPSARVHEVLQPEVWTKVRLPCKALPTL